MPAIQSHDDWLQKKSNEASERRARFKQAKITAHSMLPDVLSEQPLRLAEFERHHLLDRDSYHFECRKWGDWLSLFIQRGTTQKTWIDGHLFQDDKFLTSVNVAQTKEIRLIAGTEAGTEGRGEFIVYTERDPVKIECSYPSVTQPSRKFILGNYSRPQMGSLFFHGESPHFIPIENCAAPAQDDRIVFKSIEATLFVPFGKGKDVYNQILRELSAT